MSLNSQCGGNAVHWLKVEKPLGSGLSTALSFQWYLIFSSFRMLSSICSWTIQQAGGYKIVLFLANESLFRHAVQHTKKREPIALSSLCFGTQKEAWEGWEICRLWFYKDIHCCTLPAQHSHPSFRQLMLIQIQIMKGAAYTLPVVSLIYRFGLWNSESLYFINCDHIDFRNPNSTNLWKCVEFFFVPGFCFLDPYPICLKS